MCRRELLWSVVVFTAGVVVLMFTTSYSRAEVFWTEGFETYPAWTSIQGKDSTWSYAGGGYATVVDNWPYRGNQSLGYGVAGDINWGRATWSDDTLTMPHGGTVELSWWMYVDTLDQGSPQWSISINGWGGATVAEIAGHVVGSLSSIDVETSTGWIETMQIVTPNAWRHVSYEIDFSANPNRSRVRAGDTGPWGDWYTLNTNETYFRSMSIDEHKATVYYDDMSGSVVPEPGTVSLFASLGLSGLGLLWLRRRRA